MELSLSNVLPNTQNPQALHRPAGGVEQQVCHAYRKASLWLAQRRVWASKSPEAATSRQAFLEELDGLKREMFQRTGVRVSVGAGRSVTVARTASRLGPNGGICAVADGEERSFLAPLPLHRLYGLSAASLRDLQISGLVTIGELQRVPKAALQAEFGDAEGLRIWRSARGLDSPVTGGPEEDAAATAKAASQQTHARRLRGRLLGQLFAAALWYARRS